MIAALARLLRAHGVRSCARSRGAPQAPACDTHRALACTTDPQSESETESGPEPESESESESEPESEPESESEPEPESVTATDATNAVWDRATGWHLLPLRESTMRARG
jgi:hypothetical protein